MGNPLYGQWEYDDLDPIGWNEGGVPDVRNTLSVRDGDHSDPTADEVADRDEFFRRTCHFDQMLTRRASRVKYGRMQKRSSA